MADEKDKEKQPAAVKVKNNGIRHRLFHQDHGAITIEKGATRELEVNTAFMLLTDHPDDFEIVSVSGLDKGDFEKAVTAERKARKDAADERAKVLAAEQKEADKADEMTARTRGQ